MGSYNKVIKKNAEVQVVPDKENSRYIMRLYYNNFKGVTGFYVNYSRLEGEKFPSMYANNTESDEASHYEFQKLVNGGLEQLHNCHCVSILLNKKRYGGENDMLYCKFLMAKSSKGEWVPTVRFRKDKQVFENFKENSPKFEWFDWYLKDENGHDSAQINGKHVADYARIVKIVKDFWLKMTQPEETNIWD